MSRNKTSIQLYEMNDGLFAIKGILRVNQNTLIKGFFYIDTGSNINLVRQSIIHKTERQNQSAVFLGIGNSVSNAKETNLNFAVENHNAFHDISFIEIEDNAVKRWNNDAIGILGYVFLRRYKLVIDFDQRVIYPNDLYHMKMPVYKMRYHYHNNKTLSFLDLPIISISDGIDYYHGIIDSGSTNNLISLSTVDRSNFSYFISNFNKTNNISSIGCIAESITSVIGFSISCTSKTGVMSKITLSDKFEIILANECLLTIEGAKSNIDIVLGIEFLKKHKCVIDCGRGDLYIN